MPSKMQGGRFNRLLLALWKLLNLTSLPWKRSPYSGTIEGAATKGGSWPLTSRNRAPAPRPKPGSVGKPGCKRRRWADSPISGRRAAGLSTFEENLRSACAGDPLHGLMPCQIANRMFQRTSAQQGGRSSCSASMAKVYRRTCSVRPSSWCCATSATCSEFESAGNSQGSCGGAPGSRPGAGRAGRQLALTAAVERLRPRRPSGWGRAGAVRQGPTRMHAPRQPTAPHPRHDPERVQAAPHRGGDQEPPCPKDARRRCPAYAAATRDNRQLWSDSMAGRDAPARHGCRRSAGRGRRPPRVRRASR